MGHAGDCTARKPPAPHPTFDLRRLAYRTWVAGVQERERAQFDGADSILGTIPGN